MRAASRPPAEAWLRFSLFTKTSCAAHEVLVCSASMYVLGRVWRRRASEFGPRAKTWASCNVLEIRVTRLAQHLLAPLYAGALPPPLNPPFRGLHSRGPRGSFTRNTEFLNMNLKFMSESFEYERFRMRVKYFTTRHESPATCGKNQVL